MSTAHEEIAAMTKMAEVFTTLDEAERIRVAKWLLDAYHVTLQPKTGYELMRELGRREMELEQAIDERDYWKGVAQAQRGQP